MKPNADGPVYVKVVYGLSYKNGSAAWVTFEFHPSLDVWPPTEHWVCVCHAPVHIVNRQHEG